MYTVPVNQSPGPWLVSSELRVICIMVSWVVGDQARRLVSPGGVVVNQSVRSRSSVYQASWPDHNLDVDALNRLLTSLRDDVDRAGLRGQLDPVRPDQAGWRFVSEMFARARPRTCAGRMLPSSPSAAAPATMPPNRPGGTTTCQFGRPSAIRAAA